MGLLSAVYQGVFKRTSTFAFAICVGAIGVWWLLFASFIKYLFCFQFERGFDAFADYLWESKNQGKLWKDIKHKYEVVEEE